MSTRASAVLNRLVLTHAQLCQQHDPIEVSLRNTSARVGPLWPAHQFTSPILIYCHTPRSRCLPAREVLHDQDRSTQMYSQLTRTHSVQGPSSPGPVRRGLGAPSRSRARASQPRVRLVNERLPPSCCAARWTSSATCAQLCWCASSPQFFPRCVHWAPGVLQQHCLCTASCTARAPL
jgi:hypothetical protein